ncbi:MAG: methionyl-tRNA formyltransferase [Candidatus Saccharimonadales bacterium]
MSKPILFFGTEDFSALFLRALIDKGYDIRAVVTKPDSKKGRGQKIIGPLVKTVAREAGIAVWQPQKLVQIAQDISVLDDVAGVLVAYGKIIPESIIQLFTPGIINVHPSLLPKYRGPSPIETAILNGDTETGISIMQLTREMDAGPVYNQIAIPLTGTESKVELYDLLGKHAKAQLLEMLPSILDGSLLPTPQVDTDATYCQLIKKTDGVIDWTKPASQLEREIRAYHSWPKSQTRFGDLPVAITSARYVTMKPATPSKLIIEKSRLFVATNKDWLEILTLQPQGKKEMSIQAFLAGYRDILLPT